MTVVAALAAVTLSCAPASEPGTQQEPPPPEPPAHGPIIPVTIDATGNAHPDPVPLSRAENDATRWKSAEGVNTAWVVDFGDDSPFTESKFEVPSGSESAIAVLNEEARSGTGERDYKYTITSQDGTKVVDPDVRVIP